MKDNIRSLLLALLLGMCCSTEHIILTGALGSSLSPEGTIENASLVYRFHTFERGGKNRDLFNYLYFEGDTICFSFELEQQVDRSAIAVWFINPKTGNRFAAERVDLSARRVYGFSLLGTVMEDFYHEKLDGAIPADAYCCREIPLAVALIIQTPRKNEEKAVYGSFRILYH
jgi:hypothetical protein